jgi:hypothetical protein
MDGGNGQKTSGAEGGGGGGGEREAPFGPDLSSLARDWIELWQSELAALAAEPETAETWARLAAFWAGLAAAGLGAIPRGVADERFRPGGDAGAGREFWFGATTRGAGAAPSPRPAAGDPASDPGVAPSQRLLERILDRLDAIERRLAELEERHGGGAGGARRRGDRRRGA